MLRLKHISTGGRGLPAKQGPPTPIAKLEAPWRKLPRSSSREPSMGIGLARMVFIAFTARLAPGSVVGGDGWGGSSVISTPLSYQSKDACFLRARLSARKDPARSHHSKSKGHISRTMGVLHTALGHPVLSLRMSFYLYSYRYSFP